MCNSSRPPLVIMKGEKLHVSRTERSLENGLDSWYLSSINCSLIAQYNQVPILLSNHAWSLTPKRQEMQMLKQGESGAVLTTIKNLLNAFQLTQNLLLQVADCWSTSPPQL